MRNATIRTAVIAGILSLGMIATAATAQSPPDGTVETTRVKNDKLHRGKHPTLQFLRDNRDFLRAQIDRLRLETTRNERRDASMIDARLLRLRELSAANAAAQDTVSALYAVTPGRDLMQSVTELAALEAELAFMEGLVADQRIRLGELEADFIGRQTTALVVVLRGLDGRAAPDAIVLTEQNTVIDIPLTAEQRQSLNAGGIAQIYHEAVEPREHTFAVTFTGPRWMDTQSVTVIVEPLRDRLTFLEMDLSNLDRNRKDLGLMTTVWQR